MRTFLGALLIAFFLPVSAFATCADLTTNAVAYYKFDESSGNAADATGNGFTLTNENTVTYAPEKINNGAVMSQSSFQDLKHAYASALNLASTDFTLAGWFSVPSLPTTSDHFVFAAMQDYLSDPGAAYYFRLQNSSGTYKLQAAIIQAGGASGVTVNWTPTINTLYYIAVTYNKTNGNTKFYVNGSQQGTTQTLPTGGAHTVSGTPFYFGQYYPGGTDSTLYYNGAIDEWGIWSCELTSTQISTLYNSGAGLQYPFTASTPWFYRPFTSWWSL